MANSISSKTPFKIGAYHRQKPIRVMVLGQTAVGKTALVVRFITRRYIGEYDPTLEKLYSFHTLMDNEMVYFEILDTAGQSTVLLTHSTCRCIAVHTVVQINKKGIPWNNFSQDSDCLSLEANIRWAEVFILMYSVTDKCSFDECNRLKFLINYNKKKRRLGSNSSKEAFADVPVVLVGNKNDQWGDRMIPIDEGLKRSREIGCVCFHEISVRESIPQVWCVFYDAYRFWKLHNKRPKLKRSSSEYQGDHLLSPEFTRMQLPTLPNGTCVPNGISTINATGRRWTEAGVEEECSENKEQAEQEKGDSLPPFRARASTDGHLIPRPHRWRNPQQSTVPSSQQQYTSGSRASRRMSISMRGNNSSY